MATLAVIAPTFSEARAIARRLHFHGVFPLFRASSAGHRITLCIAGVGANVIPAVAKMVEKEKPDMAVLVGVAGALRSDLQVGAAVELASYVDEAGNRFALVGPPDGKVVATVAQLADTADAKARIHAATRADVVDMETAHVARLLAMHDVPLLSVRVVSDGAGEWLPRDFMTLIRPDGRADFGAAVWLCLRRPGYIKRLIHLGGVVDRAGETLADWVEQWIAGQP